MRVHDGGLTGEPGTQPACQTLVGGLGMPGLRDLDFGRQVVRFLQDLDWPDDVLVEDLSYAAHLVLHRVQELRPAKVVLVGVAAREGEAPGSVRRYRLDLSPPSPDAVQAGLSSGASGMIDLDHTLAVVRHWGAFPADTTVIEVQPADCSFGPGFSEELGDCIEPILGLVRQELGGVGGDTGADRDVSIDDLLGLDAPEPAPPGSEPAPGISSGLEEMAERAQLHDRLGRLEPYRNAPLVARSDDPCPISFEARSRPYGVGLRTGGDWYDVIPKSDGSFGVLLGDAVGRGTEGAAVMTELRAAVRAYAVLDDDTPGRLLSRLDRLVGMTGMGEGSALAYLHVQPASGRVRMSNAGQCPPVVATNSGTASFASEGSPLLGAFEAEREELEFVLDPDSTLFLFTAGLARSGRRSMAEGLEWVRTAAARGPRPLDAACDFVFNACLDRRPREDDAMMLALRLDPHPVPASSPVPTPSTAT